MKCYYNKPELSNEVIINGWVHTGDMAEIDMNGFLHIYGRCSDKITTATNEIIYLFDIANLIKKSPLVGDAIVLNNLEINNPSKLFVHIEWTDNVSDKDKEDYLQTIDREISEQLPEGIEIAGYTEHKKIPYSSSTLKKDKNKLARQRDGYFKLMNGNRVEFKI